MDEEREGKHESVTDREAADDKAERGKPSRSKQEERTQRIVDTAIELAEKGGYARVRLRDVAAKAGVALGTIYKRFPRKEEILVAALDLEVEALRRELRKTPLSCGSDLERITTFFRIVTERLCRRPNLARALIRAVASGEPGVTRNIARFHEKISALIVEELGIDDLSPLAGEDPPRLGERLYLLQMIWFSALVGWAGGLHTETEIFRLVGRAASLLLPPPMASS